MSFAKIISTVSLVYYDPNAVYERDFLNIFQASH